MKNASSFILGLIVILLIAGAAYTYFGKKAEAPIAINDSGNQVAVSPSPVVVPETPITPADGGVETIPTATTVTLTSAGFSPASVKIKSGQKVIFVNNSNGNMWVAADEHPSHTEYNGTDRQSHCPDITEVAFDQCADGKTYTFTFTKTGSWDYHNHLSANKTGTVIVE